MGPFQGNFTNIRVWRACKGVTHLVTHIGRHRGWVAALQMVLNYTQGMGLPIADDQLANGFTLGYSG